MDLINFTGVLWINLNRGQRSVHTLVFTEAGSLSTLHDNNKAGNHKRNIGFNLSRRQKNEESENKAQLPQLFIKSFTREKFFANSATRDDYTTASISMITFKDFVHEQTH